MELVVISSLLLAYAIAFCIKNREIPSSVSLEAYWLHRVCNIAWTVVMSLTSVLLGTFLIVHVTEVSIPIAIVATLALMISSFIPLEDNKNEESFKQYSILVAVFGISSQLTVLMNDFHMLWPWILWGVVWLVYKMIDHEWKWKIFLAEIISFLTVIMYCFSKI